MTGIGISSSGIETRFAQDSADLQFYYCGTAKLNTPEGTDGWVLKRLEIFATGQVIVTTANGPSPTFNWTAREGYTYS